MRFLTPLALPHAHTQQPLSAARPMRWSGVPWRTAGARGSLRVPSAAARPGVAAPRAERLLWSRRWCPPVAGSPRIASTRACSSPSSPPLVASSRRSRDLHRRPRRVATPPQATFSPLQPHQHRLATPGAASQPFARHRARVAATPTRPCVSCCYVEEPAHHPQSQVRILSYVVDLPRRRVVIELGAAPRHGRHTRRNSSAQPWRSPRVLCSSAQPFARPRRNSPAVVIPRRELT
jgi:hypothetical protein